MTDWKALCAELTHEVEQYADDRGDLMPECADRARAALAAAADGLAVPEGREPASVVGEPSDEEIMELMPQQMHEDLAAAVRAMAEQEGIDSTPAKGVMRIILNRHIVDLARAVLARWGRPAPPDEGEVAELVALLRYEAREADLDLMTAEQCHRAADLLEHQAAPVPVAVNERLPGAEDCDGEGKCWWYAKRYGWELQCHDQPRSDLWTHWLPATALPLPAGEVERQAAPVPVPVSERLPELRGMFERILCVARSSGQRPVGNIQLADRLISAVVSWSALPLPAGEVQP